MKKESQRHKEIKANERRKEGKRNEKKNFQVNYLFKKIDLTITICNCFWAENHNDITRKKMQISSLEFL
jgi:hypothetical protein